jgi:hypothetical protein
LWISPEVYREIQVVYPGTRRKSGRSEKKRQLVGGIRLWENQPPCDAFWTAYGKSARGFKNSQVCHIYEGSVLQPGHYTNLANLVVLPRSLESFTEWRPVRRVLEWHAYTSYGYTGPNHEVPKMPPHYPRAWPGESRLQRKEVELTVKRLERKARERPQYLTSLD